MTAVTPVPAVTATKAAAALLALRCTTHEDNPVLTVRDDGERTLAVAVDPAEPFGTLVGRVVESAEPSDVLLALTEGPTDGFRLVLSDVDGSVAGSGESELDATTFATAYQRILAQGAEDPTRPVGEHDLLTDEDRDQVVLKFNDTARPFPEHQTLPGLFREQAARTPDAVAVSTDQESLTYRELDERTDRLARVLAASGVRRGSVVGVLGSRCLDLPVALLAVLKAGAAYLPLDPAAPVLRTADMLERALAPVVVVLPGARLPEGVDLPVVHPDAPEPDGVATATPEGPRPQDLAYVIYTSGSTGRPKGVMVEHRSVVNRLTWMQRRYPLTERDTLLQKTPIVFDVSVWELFWWFFAGARLHLLAPGMERFPLAIAKTVRSQRVTALHFVPSMLGPFLDHVAQPKERQTLDALRVVFSSGESLPAALVNRFTDLAGDRDCVLVNLYGPTEATVDVTGHDCPRLPVSGPVPIGAPIDNTRVYVLRDGRPAPVGVYGTLFLAGVQVARGYLGDPELTERRFVPEHGNPSARMYDTGDIGRWLPNGELEFLGRTDTQVKIRGIRIDLGEIENVLLEAPGVAECAVLLDLPDPTRPVLRAAVSGSGDLTADALRAHAATRLPEHMLPVEHHRFDRLPRTGSGKVDRRALNNQAYVAAHGTAL